MEENYYAAPPEYDPMPKVRLLPGYVKGWAIADLVFCSLRIVLVGLGFLGLVVLGPDNPLFITALAEVLAGLGICVFGLTGNIMLLMGKPSSIPVCWINVAFTTVSILVGIWQAFIQFNSVQGPELVGALVGAGIALTIRVALLVFYSIALIRAKKVLARPDPFGPPQTGMWQ